MKKLLLLLISQLFAIIPFISIGTYYQSCSSIYGYWAVDAWNGYCKCMSWYTWYNNKCVSLYTYCQNIYGINATYNSLKNSCECLYWYWFYWWSCITYNSICQNVYGSNYYYNSSSGYCEIKKVPSVKTTNNKGNCNIKGNISYNWWTKIYHVPWCPNYNDTVIDTSKWERRFCSESEAIAAWRRKAKNCPN